MALQTNGLIIPRGEYLHLKLYHINGGSLDSASTIVNKLKEHTVEFKDRKFYEGFSDVDTNGNMISVYYTIGQPITVQRMKDNDLRSEVVYSQGKCEYIIHIREKYLECRGTSWVASRGIMQLMNILNAEFGRINLDENSMVTLCRDAAMVNKVKISDLDNPALSQIELNGEILDSAEWTIYRRQGTIKYFKGFIDLPTGSQITAQITNRGAMMIYKRGVGIPAEDVISAVDMLMKLSKN
ncbi:MAG TPA: hypothetical protein VMX55_12885 [candidate division Zixibacteria bacterium]|nr:hypothetical protein [candidate division Zixibacteria bacterium]